MLRATRIALGCAVLVLGTAQPVSATLMELTVTYSNVVRTGAISLGFTSDDVAPLPNTVDITFVLEGVGTSPSVFDETDIVSAVFSYGELNLDETYLASFDFDNSLVAASTLFYNFNPVDTLSSLGAIVFNSSFELSVTGTDRNSGLSFEYLYPNATFTFVAVPEPASAGLFVVGLLAVSLLARRRRKRCTERN